MERRDGEHEGRGEGGIRDRQAREGGGLVRGSGAVLFPVGWAGIVLDCIAAGRGGIQMRWAANTNGGKPWEGDALRVESIYALYATLSCARPGPQQTMLGIGVARDRVTASRSLQRAFRGAKKREQRREPCLHRLRSH